MEIVRALRIDRSAADVWDVLADFGAIGGWAPNVDHSCLTSTETEGPGAVRRIQTGRNTLLERVIEWEPEKRLAYSIEGLPSAIGKVTNSWELADSGKSTNVRLTSTIDAGPRPPQKLVARVVGRVLAKASGQMLQGLDDHLREEAR